MSKGIYIAGAGKDAGKTTLSLGLLKLLNSKLPKGVSFIKPLGQKTTLVEGQQVGQDSWFVDKALKMGLSFENSSPFAASSGAASLFIKSGEPIGLSAKIRRAYKYLSKNGQTVIVEGTGHPGVGSVFNLSNARVAKILETPVILVLDGGIGSTIDQFNLCSSLFVESNVPLLGVVINRIIPEKMKSVKELLGKWFEEQDITVLGYIPYDDSIAQPSLGLIHRALGAEPILAAKEGVEIAVAGHLTAFGSTEEVLQNVTKRPLRSLLVDKSRPDILDALVVYKLSAGLGPGAVIVCGGTPDARRIEALKATGIPLYATKQRMEKASGKLSAKIFKVEPYEQGKIDTIIELIACHVDADLIISRLNGDVTRKAKKKKEDGKVKKFFRKLFKM